MQKFMSLPNRSHLYSTRTCLGRWGLSSMPYSIALSSNSLILEFKNFLPYGWSDDPSVLLLPDCLVPRPLARVQDKERDMSLHVPSGSHEEKRSGEPWISSTTWLSTSLASQTHFRWLAKLTIYQLKFPASSCAQPSTPGEAAWTAGAQD